VGNIRADHENICQGAEGQNCTGIRKQSVDPPEEKNYPTERWKWVAVGGGAVSMATKVHY